MSTPVNLNGTTFNVPSTGENYAWATGSNGLSAYLIALSTGTLTKSGGAFTLTSEVNYGPTYGFILAYVKSASVNIAATGVLRLAKTDAIAWRNNANTADLPLSIDATDNLNFNGSPIANSASVTALTTRVTTAEATIVTNTTNITSNTTAIATKEPAITAGTTAQYLRGDKTFQTLDKTAVGLANVDNTSDVNKPISTATATALALKANLASPTFTGTVVLPSAQVLTSPVLNTSVSGTAVLNENNMASNSTTQVATQASIKAYVDSAVSAAGNVAYSPKSADYTVTTVDAIRTIGMTTGATTRTILLPAAASSTNRILTVVKVDSGVGTVIVDANASELINGQLTKVLTKQYEIVTLQCDGAGWALMDLGLATATAAGLVSLPDSAVMCDTGNGYGSTNARIRRFTNNTVTGTAITYADSATLGASFTINVTGIYCLTWTDRSNATANAVMGFGINSSVTLDIDAQVTAAQMRGITTLTSTNTNYTTSMTLRLTAADVIRAQTDAAAQPNSANATVQFSVVLISKT
jgi:hypothetical protein